MYIQAQYKTICIEGIIKRGIVNPRFLILFKNIKASSRIYSSLPTTL